MELSDVLSAQGMPDPAVNRLRVHLAEDGKTLRLSLHAENAGAQEAVFAYHSPVREDDASEARWLIEDHPRLRGRSSDPIAARAEQRLQALGGALRRVVLESAPEARPIHQALTDPALVRRLRVVVEEPPAASWTPWELMLAPEQSEPLSGAACSPSAADKPSRTRGWLCEAPGYTQALRDVTLFSGDPRIQCFSTCGQPQAFVTYCATA